MKNALSQPENSQADEKSMTDKRKREWIYYQCHIPLVFPDASLFQLFVKEAFNCIQQYPEHLAALHVPG